MVFMYHDIVTENDKSSGFQNKSAFRYKVLGRRFEEQVKALQDRDVIFTFDDGGGSLYTRAAPILEKYGLKGIFFIPTKYINESGFLSSEQIKEMAERGHTIGTHSHSHPANITTLTKEQIGVEWIKSVEILQAIIEKPITVGSIPNGYSSREVYAAVAQAGIKTLYTSTPTTKVSHQGNIEMIGRYVVYGDMSSEDIVKISYSINKQKSLYRKWQMVELTKKLFWESYDRIKNKVLK